MGVLKPSSGLAKSSLKELQMTPNSRQVYEFGPFVLDPSERRLLCHEAPVAVTPKVFDLLVLLVERHGRLTEKELLLKTLWPDAFVEEANLSVNVSTLRRVLAEAGGAAEWIETVPKRGYRFVGETVARRVEASPGDASPPAASTEIRSATPMSPVAPGRAGVGRRLLPLAAVALLAAAIGIAWARWSTSTDAPRRVGAAADIDTMAILPFLPLGDERDADALGLGLADALITRLSNLHEITVKPTSTVVGYGRPGRDARAAGRELGVDGVLEGHIQRDGSAIRVTVQLLHVRDGAPLWADRFDADAAGMFGLEDSISERIAHALSLTLSGAERQLLAKRITRDAVAYEDYQMGRFLQLRNVAADAEAAGDHFRRAIARDPSFAAAHAGLATALITTAGGGRPGDYVEAARVAGEALRLDPDLPDAHLAMGWVAMYSQWQWADAERAFRRAVALGPSASISHLALSTVLTATGRHDDAIAHMRAANELEPSSVLIVRDLAWTYLQARQYLDAERWSRRAIDMNPSDGRSHRDLARALLGQGKVDPALVALGEAERLGANIAVELGAALAAGATVASARVAEASPPTPPFEMARFHAVRGNATSAFAALDRAAEERSARIAWLATEPDLDSLRADPRFAALAARVHLTIAPPTRGMGR